MSIGLNNNDKSRNPIPEEKIIEYFYEKYAKVMAKYEDKIKFINNQLTSLRNEREELIKIKIPEMKKKLEESGIKEEYINEWLLQFRYDTQKSLDLNESLLKTFYIETAADFRKTIEEFYFNNTVRNHG